MAKTRAPIIPSLVCRMPGKLSPISSCGRGALHLRVLHTSLFAKFRLPHPSHNQSAFASSSEVGGGGNLRPMVGRGGADICHGIIGTEPGRGARQVLVLQTRRVGKLTLPQLLQVQLLPSAGLALTAPPGRAAPAPGQPMGSGRATPTGSGRPNPHFLVWHCARWP